MKQGTLYIKIEQNNKVDRKRVLLEDIATLYCTDNSIIKTLNKLVVLVVKGDGEENYFFSILKIIEMISKQYPEIDVVNLGETDFIISYNKTKTTKQTLEIAKTVFVCCIVFVGAAFSIMTFNTDVSVSDVFQRTYRLLGIEENGKIIEIAYSIGLPIGIFVFFNHFSGKKLTKDPTPLQIEMRTYEEELNKAMIKNAEREGKTIDAD